MSPQEKYELFERYCSNALSGADDEALTQLIQEDAAIEEELKLYQELNSHLEASIGASEKRTQLQQNIEQIGDAYFKGTKKKTKVIKMPLWGYAAAASVAILLVFYIFTLRGPTYTDFANIPTIAMVERGSANELMKQAEEAFNSKNYVEAEESMAELLAEDENNAEYQFYYGITLLEQNKYEEASRIFEKLQQGRSVYQYKAVWFEALNQLKQKQYDRCSALLKTIPEEAEDYERARKLLRRLD